MKIICIGRNYSDHIKEMASEKPAEPVFFIKPDTALIPGKLPFFIPDFSNDIHYELEVVLKICKVGKHIQSRFAHLYFDKIGLGIDFTARDVQRQSIEKGLPWEKAKAFDFSAPVSKFFPIADFENLAALNFKLEKNGTIVQDGNTANMIFSFAEIIAHVSQFITLKTGDLIFTGTPSGVGRVDKEDILTAYLADKQVLQVRVK